MAAIGIIGLRSVPAVARAIVLGSARRCGLPVVSRPSCGKSIPTEVTSAPATRVCISGWAAQPLLAFEIEWPSGKKQAIDGVRAGQTLLLDETNAKADVKR